ncbi:MAG TPA: cysteine--1-D-myo-inosityl 2-amino-2-deoxy-alpha-D-glucopyranoside ligase [Acidothermaceae bacterium]|jgi:L-cysteine:1D-myo-inositol 2-amino-2-deoxy-alpha-D-glucopyranoside ligase
MQPWPAPQASTSLAALPGKSPLPKVWDTATQSLATVGSAAGASIYVCGITPYDATHLGHAATYVGFDLLNRVWRDAGVEVDYVQNVTDVDDPLLERAAVTGETWQELAAREIALFHRDMTALRVLPPQHYVGVVESIAIVVALIQKLQADGAAYDVDGDLYFAVNSSGEFGSVSHDDRAVMLELFAERGGDPERPGKRDPLDSLLWRAERPGEPAWDAAIGRGRPGWHVECTAIALEYLEAPLSVQGGGRDLVFPHHEMCAAQGAVITGGPFARSYVHAGMVGYDGAKMSKSRGNLVFVSKLLSEGVDPMAIRLALLAHHYRSDWEYTQADLDSATTRLETWRAATTLLTAPSADGVLAVVRERLGDDLDAPGALVAIDDWASSALAAGGGDAAAPELVRAVADLLLGIAL